MMQVAQNTNQWSVMVKVTGGHSDQDIRTRSPSYEVMLVFRPLSKGLTPQVCPFNVYPSSVCSAIKLYL